MIQSKENQDPFQDIYDLKIQPFTRYLEQFT